MPYAVKIHGSALEYVVKPYPRFRPYAVEGLARARGVLVGSRHTAASRCGRRWPTPRCRGGRGWGRRGSTSSASRRATPGARAGLAALRARLTLPRLVPVPSSDGDAAEDGEPPSSFDRDAPEADAALAAIEPGDRVVVFVGKLIGSKGVELLLAAWPLVLAREPRARLVIVGFGAFRAGLEAFAAGLAAAVRWRRRGGSPARSSRRSPRSSSQADYEPPGDLRISWAGRFEHSELADLLPAAEAMAVTSTFPEAFGMVAVEAAAGGALPVVANHSGLGEVARTLAAAVPEAARRGSRSRSARTPSGSSRTRSRAGWRRRRTLRARPAARSSARRGSAIRGRASRARSSRPPGASSTTSRTPDARPRRAAPRPPRWRRRP